MSRIDLYTARTTKTRLLHRGNSITNPKHEEMQRVSLHEATGTKNRKATAIVRGVESFVVREEEHGKGASMKEKVCQGQDKSAADP
jgi:hypothetical protein